MALVGTRPPLTSETNLYELHHRARLGRNVCIMPTAATWHIPIIGSLL